MEFKTTDFNINTLRELYSQLEDELSKKVFLTRVNYCISTQNENFMFSLNEPNDKFLSLIFDDDNLEKLNMNLVFPKTFDKNKHTIFYGIGGFFKQYFNMYTNLISNYIFCDRNYKTIKSFNGVDLISPDELFRDFNSNQIVITMIDNIQLVYDYLLENGLKKENIFVLMYTLPDVKIDYNDEKCIKDYYANNFPTKLLVDYKNVIIHPAIIFKTQYFDQDIIKWENDTEVFDCGAFDGMTSVYFNQLCTAKNKKAYIFEPNLKQYGIIKNNNLIKQLNDYVIYNVGAWSEKTKLKFDCDGTSSSISSEGSMSINVDKLDNIIVDTKVSYIKMDIEGAELEALKGAERLIKNFKPKLAICVYHKSEDIITIQTYIKSLVPEYKIYLRHYGIFDAETIIYAVI